VKVPLRDQITNYDCGPTSILNALSRLFQREEIPPVVMRHVITCSMDWLDDLGRMGRRGTTHAAMSHVAAWLAQVGELGVMPLTCRYLTGERVTLGAGSELREALDRGACAVAFIDLDGWHYVLITAVEGESVYAYDPWRLPEPFPVPDVTTDYGHPYDYNRIVPLSRFESTEIHPYSLGPYETREAVVLERK
jgi:hypothetical protein